MGAQRPLAFLVKGVIRALEPPPSILIRTGRLKPWSTVDQCTGGPSLGETTSGSPLASTATTPHGCDVGSVPTDDVHVLRPCASSFSNWIGLRASTSPPDLGEGATDVTVFFCVAWPVGLFTQGGVGLGAPRVCSTPLRIWL